MSSTEICESLFVIAGIYLLRHLTACCQPIGCNCTFCCHLMRPDQARVVFSTPITSCLCGRWSISSYLLIWYGPVQNHYQLHNPEMTRVGSWQCLTLNQTHFQKNLSFRSDLVLVLDLGFPNAPELKHQLLHWSCLVADWLDCCWSGQFPGGWTLLTLVIPELSSSAAGRLQLVVQIEMSCWMDYCAV